MSSDFLKTQKFDKIMEATLQTNVGYLGSFGFREIHLTNDVKEVFQFDTLLDRL